MNRYNILQQCIHTTAQARHNYLISKDIIDREVYRCWYMWLGTIAFDESETMELRQEALDAMHRLQMSLS